MLWGINTGVCGDWLPQVGTTGWSTLALSGILRRCVPQSLRINRQVGSAKPARSPPAPRRRVWRTTYREVESQ